MNTYHYHLCDKDAYRVSIETDGKRVYLGKIRRIYICHLQTHAWESTDGDGTSFGIHQWRWQAVWSLKWSLDGRKGFPFPVPACHQKEIECGETELSIAA